MLIQIDKAMLIEIDAT